MSKTVHILVSGKVQGVGYRMFALAHAEAVGASGWVRNLTDGRVEALVYAEEEALENLLAHLKQGPRRSHVENLECKEVKIQLNSVNFEVKEDGSKTWSEN